MKSRSLEIAVLVRCTITRTWLEQPLGRRQMSSSRLGSLDTSIYSGHKSLSCERYQIPFSPGAVVSDYHLLIDALHALVATIQLSLRAALDQTRCQALSSCLISKNQGNTQNNSQVVVCLRTSTVSKVGWLGQTPGSQSPAQLRCLWFWKPQPRGHR